MRTPNDGEPAFPVPVGEREFWDREENGSPNGMSLRDWFARNTPHDEVCEMTYRHLSRSAQERLAGIPYPAIDRNAGGDQAVDQQIAEMAFHARVNAALRYISADAMLAARKEGA